MNKYNFKRLCKAMFWSKLEDAETWEEVAERNQVTSLNYPHSELIDVVYYNGVEVWAEFQDAESLEELQSNILKLFQLAISDKILSDKSSQKIFRRIYNFCIYADNLDRRGKLMSESEKIAGTTWWGNLAVKRLKSKTDKIFSAKPNKKEYQKITERIKEVWGFTDAEIDALRYFVCQTREENFNPSLNKSIYFWSEKKQTGKTSVARALASVLNGGTSVIDGGNYESTFNVELQLNPHDLPASCKYNCVILDEAMPKDSSKSYGRVKSMLTSNNVTYNQKFSRIQNLKAKRFYLFTSNEDVRQLIQDDSERRLIEIQMNDRPVQISFEEIYSIWKKFAQNCTPEKDWQEWYNSFNHVEGVERLDINYFHNELVNNDEILQSLEQRTTYNVTLKTFEDFLCKGKPSRIERDRLRKALIELFGASNRKDGVRWSRNQCVLKIKELRGGVGIIDEVAEDLPF